MNPVQVELRPANGGIGAVEKSNKSKSKKLFDEEDFGANVADKIDMDLYDKAGEKKREEEAKQGKKKLDAEDKAFLDLFKRGR